MVKIFVLWWAIKIFVLGSRWPTRRIIHEKALKNTDKCKISIKRAHSFRKQRQLQTTVKIKVLLSLVALRAERRRHRPDAKTSKNTNNCWNLIDANKPEEEMCRPRFNSLCTPCTKVVQNGFVKVGPGPCGKWVNIQVIKIFLPIFSHCLQEKPWRKKKTIAASCTEVSAMKMVKKEVLTYFLRKSKLL